MTVIDPTVISKASNSISVTPTPESNRLEVLQRRLPEFGLSEELFSALLWRFRQNFGDPRANELACVFRWRLGLPVHRKEEIEIIDGYIPPGTTFEQQEMLHRCFLIERISHELSENRGRGWFRILSGTERQYPDFGSTYAMKRDLEEEVRNITILSYSDVLACYREMINEMLNYETNRLVELERAVLHNKFESFQESETIENGWHNPTRTQQNRISNGYESFPATYPAQAIQLRNYYTNTANHNNSETPAMQQLCMHAQQYQQQQHQQQPTFGYERYLQR